MHDFTPIITQYTIVAGTQEGDEPKKASVVMKWILLTNITFCWSKSWHPLCLDKYYAEFDKFWFPKFTGQSNVFHSIHIISSEMNFSFYNCFRFCLCFCWPDYMLTVHWVCASIFSFHNSHNAGGAKVFWRLCLLPHILQNIPLKIMFVISDTNTKKNSSENKIS